VLFIFSLFWLVGSNPFTLLAETIFREAAACGECKSAAIKKRTLLPKRERKKKQEELASADELFLPGINAQFVMWNLVINFESICIGNLIWSAAARVLVELHIYNILWPRRAGLGNHFAVCEIKCLLRAAWSAWNCSNAGKWSNFALRNFAKLLLAWITLFIQVQSTFFYLIYLQISLIMTHLHADYDLPPLLFIFKDIIK
jgi:hypothetical protein